MRLVAIHKKERPKGALLENHNQSKLKTWKLLRALPSQPDAFVLLYPER